MAMPDTVLGYQNEVSQLTYLQEHWKYIGVFMLVVLVMYWTIGAKPTFYFMLLVLLGQLMVYFSNKEGVIR